ncbi:MAG: hypothetical protein E3J65_03185 [Dehalococcoidia bacterium]|nr:MAG: hypothetical protein E3J65_03185 [Dehalococcoidia bacterium]
MGGKVRIEGKIREASFLQRLNQFSALVELEGSEEVVYLANSGRMEELLQPGRPVLLEERFAPHRKTCYDLIIVALGEKWSPWMPECPESWSTRLYSGALCPILRAIPPSIGKRPWGRAGWTF